MRWFSSTVLAVTLIFSGSAASAVNESALPSSAPIATASAPVKQVEQDSTEKKNSQLCQLLPQLCEALPELGDLPEVPSAPDSENECSPLFSWCLWDPFYGSCEWDAWYGVYVCDQHFYREGYECWYDSRLDWQWVCREKGGGYSGWWW